MKKFVWTTVLACLALLSVYHAPVLAQVDCAPPNTLALFFDNGDINTTPTVAVPFEMYFAVINPTVDHIDGIEWRMEDTFPNMFILSRTYARDHIDVGTSPDHVIGFASPVPVSAGQIVFSTWTLMTLTDGPFQFFVSETSIPSIPGTMAYSSPDTGSLVPMTAFSRSYDLPMVSINAPYLNYCDVVEPLLMSVDVNFDGDNANVAGTSIGATDGYDSDYDLIDTNLALTFPHPEWNSPAGNNFRHDIKAAFDPTMEVKQWTFVASASADVAQSGEVGGRDVTVQMLPNFTNNFSFEFWLYDRTTGATTDLFAQNNVTFHVPAGATIERTYDLFIGHEVFVDPGMWVDVTASTGGYSEEANRLATNLDATDGYDGGLDIPEPIHAPSNYMSSSFMHDDWPLGPRFRTDVRALFDPTIENKTWPLRVETDQSGTIVLSFGASFTAQDNIGLQLRDLQTGQTFNLFPQMNYAFETAGPSPYDFQIIVGESGPPELSPTSRDLTMGWSLVGFPLMPVTQTLGDVIWDQAPGYAYMFDYQKDIGYGMQDPADLALQTKGYWIATDSNYNWTMSGNPNLSDVTVDLTQGWNLVGNPMWFPGPFEGMAIVDNGTIMPWLTALDLGLVATGVQSYNPNTGWYFDAVDLQPWEGYWINALKPGLQLLFNWNNFQNLPARLTVQKSEIPVDDRAWSADLTLWDSKRLQTTITMGINPEATTGFDPRFDMAQPPAPPSGGPVLAFTRPEWNLASGSYFSRDVMPPSDEPMTWNAVISVANPGKANLVWDSSSWPKNADFQIYLPTENRVIVMSMRDQSSVTIDMGTASMPIVIRTPNLMSGVDTVPGLTYRVGVHPNPFNPMTTVSFDLPKGGDVEIRLYSVRGELVNVLAGTHYVAGSHQVIWQGQDRSGRNVPSGSYFAKLYVDGRAMGSVTKMSLVR